MADSFDEKPPSSSSAVKIILLGDSASGKTKLMERFLMDKLFVL
jgi:GTPase SAR1 family protein